MKNCEVNDMELEQVSSGIYLMGAVYQNRDDVKTLGAIRHIAFATDDVDGVIAKVKDAGYEVFIEPNDITIRSTPEVHARMAFCFGPLGEQIEFFNEDG